MAKTEVYSWRLSTELKQALEEEARARGATLARILDEIVQGWLESAAAVGREADLKEQRRLQAAAGGCIGSIRGGDPRRAEEAGSRVRGMLRRKHGGQ